jgi:hypothetical protein
MAYTPDPTNTAQPTDDQYALTGAAEFRALKAYLATLSGLNPAVSGLISINGGQIAGFRNRLINGDMRIDQRYVGTAVTPVGNQYVLDRWMTTGPASKVSFQQVADAPPGFNNSVKLTVVAQYSPGVGEIGYMAQKIEGNNMIDLGFGAAGAATIVASFWVKASVAGTYSFFFGNGNAPRFYVSTFAATTSWTKVSIVIPGDITGTWSKDTSIGAYFGFDWGSGTNYVAPATNTWQGGTYAKGASGLVFCNQIAGSTLQFTGLQLEIGSVATTFEQRSIGIELMLCQRYFEKSFPQTFVPANGGAGAFATNLGLSSGYSSNAFISLFIPFKTLKRATPTIVNYGNASSQWVVDGVFSANAFTGSGTLSDAGIGINQQVAGTGFVCGHWTASAEL